MKRLHVVTVIGLLTLGAAVAACSSNDDSKEAETTTSVAAAEDDGSEDEAAEDEQADDGAAEDEAADNASEDAGEEEDSTTADDDPDATQDDDDSAEVDDAAVDLLIAGIAQSAGDDGLDISDDARACIKSGLKGKVTLDDLLALGQNDAAQSDPANAALLTNATGVVFGCLDIDDVLSISGVDGTYLTDKLDADSDRIAVLLTAGVAQAAGENGVTLTDEEQTCLVEELTGKYTVEDFYDASQGAATTDAAQERELIATMLTCVPAEKVAAAGVQPAA